MILDDYVLRDFGMNLAMVVAAFLMLLLVFTLFELLGDILRNQISPLVVGEYLLNVSPYFVYNITPLSILLAVLITLGVMQRSNEITAIKTTGISIYRIVTPLVVAAAILAAGLFFADQFYLPHANKRQDALRNLIKGKPAQTYLNPDRKWIFGQHSDIYYYELFDSDRDQFGSLAVFQFDPVTFQLTKRIYAERAHWEDSSAALGLHSGMGARSARPRHRKLSHLRCSHVPCGQRTSDLLQEGSEAVFRNEL